MAGVMYPMIWSPNGARISTSWTRAGNAKAVNCANAREKRVTPLEAAEPPQCLIQLEAVDQRLGGQQVQHRLGDEGPRQGHPILRRTPDEPPTRLDEAIALRELQHADHLLERQAQLHVILLPQQGEQFMLEVVPELRQRAVLP